MTLGLAVAPYLLTFFVAMSLKHVVFTCFVAIFLNIATATYYDDDYYENGIVYNSYTSHPASEDEITKFENSDNHNVCIKEIKECHDDDYSRLDGACNNLNYPAVGTFNTPRYRMVPGEYGENFTMRTAQDGGSLPAERKCRTQILLEGKASHPKLNMLFGYFVISLYANLVATHDESKLIKTGCCSSKGKDDDLCAPMDVPEDDPVHRFSGLRCMNMTKPLTFQHYGCAGHDTEPARIGNYTHTLDLSYLYYITPTAMNEVRTFAGGMLKVEEEDGIVWPLNADSTEGCPTNVSPNETRCFKTIESGLIGTTLVTIWYYRLHNFVASKLSRINPCWSDQQIFDESRQIVIALQLQMLFYEVLPLVLGRESMIAADIISFEQGFRDIYDKNVLPNVSEEFVYTGRWFHTMQEGTVEMYDSDYNYVKEIPISFLTKRSGYLNAEHIEMLTLGSTIQPLADIDDSVDPVMTGIGFGSRQWSTDILANDLARGRLYGLAPYVKYRDFCSNGKTHSTYDDIANYIKPERLPYLKRLYKNASDIDMIAGMWAEKIIPNGYCAYTVSCIMIKGLQRIVAADRHWYERPNRPHAFTLSQLLQIRKMTAAQLLCAVGDGITHIQPQALLLPGTGNEIVSCNKIPKINFRAWRDQTCRRSEK